MGLMQTGTAHFWRYTAALVCALVALALPLTIRSQQAASKETIGWVPREILERPVILRHGIGVAHQKVTTSSTQAQAF